MTTTTTDTAPEETLPTQESTLAHKPGCPQRRTETYPATRPANAEAAIPAKPLTITRCLDCGNHDVKETR